MGDTPADKVSQNNTLKPKKNPTSPTLPDYNWQAKFTTLREKLSYALTSNQFTDVVFLVGPAKDVVECNKFMLSVNSSVFAAMFSTRWSTNETQIELPDVDPLAFKVFLKYLYTEDMKVRTQDALSLLYLAKKYDIPSLCEKCIKLLEKNVNTLNAVTIYQKAQIFEEQNLEDLTKDFICKNAKRVFAGQDYLTLTNENLCYFLGLDELKIDESSLIRAVHRWTQDQCIHAGLEEIPENYRKVLGEEAIKLIRFPLLTPEEFTFEVADKGLLADHDLINILKYYSVSPDKRIELPQLNFNSSPRTPLFSPIKYTMNRFGGVRSCEYAYDNTNAKRSCCFKTNRSISIVSIGLYGPSRSLSPSTFLVHLQIFDSESQTLSGSKIANREVIVKPGEDIFHVEFDSPVKLNPFEFYTISLDSLQGSNTIMGESCKPEVTVRCGLNEEVIFKFKGAEDYNTQVQIPELCFMLV